MTTFTPDEEAQFTFVNCVAFDLMRTTSTGHSPFWLCTNEETRKEYQQKVVDLTNKLAYMPVDLQLAENILSKRIPKAMVDQWRRFELEAKTRRDNNDPSGFFAP